MRSRLIITTVFALTAGFWGQSVYAQIEIPEGFSEEEFVNMDKYERIRGDFDGDGKEDSAMLIHKEDGSMCGVYAFLLYLTGDNKNHILRFPSGTAPVVWRARNDVIEFGYVTILGNGRFSWDFKVRYFPPLRRVQIIGMDSAYRIGEYSLNPRTNRVEDWHGLEKSYNLLTGDYNVTVAYSILAIPIFDKEEPDFLERIIPVDDDTGHRHFHVGNKSIRYVFMDELSLDWETSDKGVFGELNMVGYEFEKLYGMTRQ